MPATVKLPDLALVASKSASSGKKRTASALMLGKKSSTASKKQKQNNPSGPQALRKLVILEHKRLNYDYAQEYRSRRRWRRVENAIQSAGFLPGDWQSYVDDTRGCVSESDRVARRRSVGKFLLHQVEELVLRMEPAERQALIDGYHSREKALHPQANDESDDDDCS